MLQKQLKEIANKYNVIFPLLCRGSDNPKLKKLEVELGLHSAILYLLPNYLLCPRATSTCMAGCLMRASGRALFDPSIVVARRNRSNFLRYDQFAFLARIEKEMQNLIIRAQKLNLLPAARLNGGSDTDIFDYIYSLFPSIQFWDYTKVPSRVFHYLDGEYPDNYHVTFSRAENNDAICKEVLANGGNVAVVFRSKALPQEYNGYPVINGDRYDYRFRDMPNCIVGLSAKGKLKKDTSGFVVDV